MSRVIGELSLNRTINEVFPSELISFLDYEATPQNPPKRSLDDAWTSESPMTPFVSEGALRDTVSELYTGYAATIAKQFGLQLGESAVVLNGRVRRGSLFAFPSLANDVPLTTSGVVGCQPADGGIRDRQFLGSAPVRAETPD